MLSREAADEAEYSTLPLVAPVQTLTILPTRSNTVGTLLWAVLASTAYRVRIGEGALLAVNLSLIVYQGVRLPRFLAQTAVSILTLGLMYAFNDLYDAPTDANNPKKDRALISTYNEHRRAAGLTIFILKLLTLALAFATLGVSATVAAAAVMLVNVAYSVLLKGVPVVDVAWCALWGALYAAIVGAPPSLLLLVGLMTAICHLSQTLDDRITDAANGITTTAVRSAALSRNVLAALSVLLCAVLRAPFGPALALTGFTPLALFFVVGKPRTAWLLTKVYFGCMWLYLLGMVHASG
jgi:4-hydroxybenzoate polyprenyltransferase